MKVIRVGVRHRCAARVRYESLHQNAPHKIDAGERHVDGHRDWGGFLGDQQSAFARILLDNAHLCKGVEIDCTPLVLCCRELPMSHNIIFES